MNKEPMPGVKPKPVPFVAERWQGRRRRCKPGKAWLACKPHVLSRQRREKPISRTEASL